MDKVEKMKEEPMKVIDVEETKSISELSSDDRIIIISQLRDDNDIKIFEACERGRMKFELLDRLEKKQMEEQ